MGKFIFHVLEASFSIYFEDSGFVTCGKNNFVFLVIYKYILHIVNNTMRSRGYIVSDMR